jgi:RNA polymerase sigma factor (sigma-70 family)
MTDREIYEQVRGRLMRFAASLVGPYDAADVVSEAIVKTLRSRTLSSLDNPQADLMTAVLNGARSMGRRAARERKALTHMGVPRSEEIVVGEDTSDLTDAVAELPVQQRAAVYLVYWEDLAPIDAAQLMGVRPATLRRYLHLARQKLRRYVDE